MCFRKSDTSSLIGLLRNFLPLILGLMCPYKSLLLALVQSTLSHASHSKGDVSVTSLKGLVKAIFLFESAKSVVLVVNSIKGGLRLSAVNCQVFFFFFFLCAISLLCCLCV